MSANKHLQAAGYSIASNIFVQVLSRGFTFILGAITLKYLQSSALLGIINVRLALLYSTLQFLSREPFRRACLGSAARSNQKNWQKIVNTIWLGFVLAILLGIPLAYTWKLNSPSKEDLVGTSIEDYSEAVVIICLVVLVEMLAEPCFIYAQAKAISDHNPRVEVLAVTLKCITTAFITVSESNEYKSGQSSFILTKIVSCQLLASAISVIFSYSRLCSTQKISPLKFIPRLTTHTKPEDGNNFISRHLDVDSLNLSFSFVSQTFLKQFLTEGERYIMTFFNVISLSEQGIYDVINNLGSLAARLIFRPIEDSGYTLFSQTVTRTELLDIRKFYRVQENLLFLVKVMFLLGLIILTFGYNFVPLIVIYGGSKLANPLAFHLMRWQLIYTPILAINGVTECFTFAIMTPAQIHSYNIFLIFSSIAFTGTIYLTRSMLGCACFIFSNCVVMCMRIFFSYKLIEDYFDKHGYELHLADIFPNLTTLISMSGVFTFLSLTTHYFLDITQPLLVVFSLVMAGWSLMFMILVVMRHEEPLLSFAGRLFKQKKY